MIMKVALVVISLLIENITSLRPEKTLLNLAANPFAPTNSVYTSSECMQDSLKYLDELKKYSPWALQMYDASAKIPSGIISGNIQALGNYDECLKVITGQSFTAQACTASVRFDILPGRRLTDDLDMHDLFYQFSQVSKPFKPPHRTIKYEWMWCVPSSCNYLEISEALKSALEPLKVDGRLDFTVDVNSRSCHTTITNENNKNFDSLDWSYTWILIFFGCIILLSTVYDIRKKRNTEGQLDNKVDKFYSSFSLYSNGKELFSTKRPESSIDCLDGIRYLSICWIIYGHTFYQEAVSVKINRTNILKTHEDWSFMLILNANIATDSFFLLSGILLSYTTLRKRSKDERALINLGKSYLNRYFRVTPAYAVAIGFYMSIFEKLGSGPCWDNWVHKNKVYCRENWWTNLLYINNYINLEKICMSQSWYISMDMQLFWFSSILLYILVKLNNKNMHFFWTIITISLLASAVIPFFVTYEYQLTGTMLYYKNLNTLYPVFKEVYTKTYARAGPYLIGIIFGYHIFKNKSKKLKISRVLVVSGWFIAISAIISVIFLPRSMYYDDDDYNLLEASTYAGLHRHIFAVSVGWIIFACVHGYAGPVNSFLSWPIWAPLSRLTYCAYLSHFAVLLYRSGIERTASILSKFDVFHSFIGNLGLTMLISIILSICIEMPFIKIIQLVLVENKREKDLKDDPRTESLLNSNTSDNQENTSDDQQ